MRRHILGARDHMKGDHNDSGIKKPLWALGPSRTYTGGPDRLHKYAVHWKYHDDAWKWHTDNLEDERVRQFCACPSGAS